ncbi:hypothetical protein [Leptospira stimsonii]|uniref:Uncharacterized protein n=1 Tax=Leptospira stimsonii TaxID=2202203 RepID=A0ABY2MVB6_9LEPT|nr:hypothetical protein [Leptospira stimsonii]TGK13231.1 hypothetical protein EHO98_17985 [Leptospira stimsonii]TGM09008.1 hypothetical protein EHQ90_20725 [Leptospira stimsonii]
MKVIPFGSCLTQQNLRLEKKPILRGTTFTKAMNRKELLTQELYEKFFVLKIFVSISHLGSSR